MDNTHIKTTIEELLKSMHAQFDAVDITEDPAFKNTIFIIKTKEPEVLIGEDGETFSALTHLIRRMANKGHYDEITNFSIDVNDYKRNEMENLKAQAKIFADKVRTMKSDMEMNPMSPYQRLIVHGALNNEPHIKTESVGDGKDRKVIVRYIA